MCGVWCGCVCDLPSILTLVFSHSHFIRFFRLCQYTILILFFSLLFIYALYLQRCNFTLCNIDTPYISIFTTNYHFMFFTSCFITPSPSLFFDSRHFPIPKPFLHSSHTLKMLIKLCKIIYLYVLLNLIYSPKTELYIIK